MLTIKRIEVNMLRENCYIVNDETKECMIVDCGALYPEDSEAIYKYIHENGLMPVVHALTHAHFDHILGCEAIAQKYGIFPTLCAKDENLYRTADEQVQQMLGADFALHMPPLERLVKDGDTVSFGNTTFKVIETPGHTPGGVFYYSENDRVAFAGDTLFRGSIGRTDLPGGSMFQIIQSLRMITQLPDDVEIMPGHGPETTIGDELATNMYLDR